MAAYIGGSMIEIPSIITQGNEKGIKVAYYDFRKAKSDGVDYFNAALIRRLDGLWLVTRRSIAWQGFQYGKNDLMAFKLDDNHVPQYGVPIAPPRTLGEHFEDPRAFQHDGRWWLSACNFVIYPDGSWTGAHQILLEINEEWQVLRRRDPIYGGNGSDVTMQRGDEKNWLWFSHGGELHMIYMTQPHIVVKWTDTLQVAEQYTDNGWNAGWHHGKARGGSAPVRVGDLYFSFFHSSEPWQNGKRRYHMGAYAFEAHPPFRVKMVTPKPILSGSLDDPWGEDKPLVVFPCAAIFKGGDALCFPVHRKQHKAAPTFDPKGAAWTISLGVNDLASAWCEIPHKWLLKKLSNKITQTEEPRGRMSDSELIYG